MMPGIDPLGALLDSNVRVLRGTAMTTPTTNTSDQVHFFVAVPSAQNQKCEGVMVEDAVETGYPLAATANPTTVTGTTPASPYDLRKRSWALARHGRVWCIAYDGNIVQGDLLIIADAYGRVQRSTGVIGSGQEANLVGRALNNSNAANDLIQVDLELVARRM
jgi:hypothetical protein